MSRRAALRNAAHWALADKDGEAPRRAADVRATLDDPALAEALEQAAAFGRLSDGDIRAMRAARRRNVAALGAVALVATIGLGTWSAGWFAGSPAPVVAHYETQRGQQQDVRLADGTTLHLSGATSLDVTLDDRRRVVALRQGEAYFDVAHEAGRPFVVHAGDSATRVLGTAFDVDVARGGDVKLSVYRGRVRFGSALSDARSVEVPAGWRSRFSDGVARAPTRFDATQQDWRQDWVDTDDMRLADLVDALNRRGGPEVMEPPPALAGIALSGRFKLDNSRQLLDAIGAAYGFAVVREGDRLRLVATAD
jgi:transmembrane sensor